MSGSKRALLRKKYPLMTDFDAAKVLRSKYRVSRLPDKENAQVSEVQRMQDVLRDKERLLQKLIEEMDILKSMGFTTGRDTHNAALACLADCGLYAEASMFCSNFAPVHCIDDASYTSLLLAAAHECGVTEAQHLWDEMSVAGIKPTSEAYGAYLGILSRNGLQDDFLNIFECFRQSGLHMKPSHYAMRILFCSSTSEAFDLLPDLVTDKVAISAVITMALLKVARRTKDSAGVREILRFSSQSRIKLGLKEWCAALSAFKDSGDLLSTKEAYEKMPQGFKGITSMPEVIVMKAIVGEIHAKVTTLLPEDIAGLVSEAEALHLKARRCRMPTGHSFTEMFRIYGALKDKEKSQKLLLQFKKSNVRQGRVIEEAISTTGLTPPERRTSEGFAVWGKAPADFILRSKYAHSLDLLPK